MRERVAGCAAGAGNPFGVPGRGVGPRGSGGGTVRGPGEGAGGGTDERGKAGIPTGVRSTPGRDGMGAAALAATAGGGGRGAGRPGGGGGRRRVPPRGAP